MSRQSVMRGKMPTFPNTYAGGKGLEVMPAAQSPDHVIKPGMEETVMGP